MYARGNANYCFITGRAAVNTHTYTYIILFKCAYVYYTEKLTRCGGIRLDNMQIHLTEFVYCFNSLLL